MADGMNVTGAEMSMHARKAIARGINMLALSWLGEAQRDAPLDEGTLRGSGSIDEATPMKLEATITFDTPYAAKQHEDVTLKHSEGKAKFLEDVVKRHAREAERVIGTMVKKAIELDSRGHRG